MLKNSNYLKNFAFIFLIGDLLLIAFSLIFGDEKWLLSSQVAFIASMLITFASFYGYKKMIEQKVQNGEYEEFQDQFDLIDNPHDLYSEIENQEIDLKEVVKEERAKIKGVKNGVVNTTKSLTGIFSPYRLIAYLFLVASFLYMNVHGVLNIWGFLSGLVVVPFISTFAKFIIKD
jgi:hypothetical protein